MKERLEHRRLPCGTEVVADVRPRSASAAVGWFVRVGSRDEPAAWAGVSHFLEHMAFKGAGGLDADGLNRRLDALGARSNAFTGEDRTAYFGSVLPENLGDLNALLGSMMRPTLRDEDVETERRVILEEIAMNEDEPESRTFDAVAASYFGDHPLARPILGTGASVGAIGGEELRAWLRECYRPDRRTVVLSGRFDLERELERIAAIGAAAVDAEDRGPTRSVDRAEPSPRAGASRVEDARLARAYGAILAPGVPQGSSERIAAALLARVLGEPGEGALHWAVVDPGLADDAGLSHEAGDGFGTFTGWFATSARHESEVRDRSLEVLRTARRRDVDEEAWRRAQRTLATDVMLASETPLGRLMALGDDWIERGRVSTPDERVREILSCGPDAGAALLAREPFERLHVLTLGPPEGAGQARAGSLHRTDARPVG